MLGCPSLINPCGVSFRDLVRLGDSGSSLDQISLDTLILKGLEVLKNRLAESTEALESSPSTHDAAAHSLLSRTLHAHTHGDGLVVFLVPSFHSRKIWIQLVNRHFNNQAEGSLPICKVRILEKVGWELNVHNTPRETGLLSRHVDEWRVSDFQESYQLFPHFGPFARLREGGMERVEGRSPEHLTYLLENITDHLFQLLVISLSPLSHSIPVVPCNARS